MNSGQESGSDRVYKETTEKTMVNQPSISDKDFEHLIDQYEMEEAQRLSDCAATDLIRTCPHCGRTYDV